VRLRANISESKQSRASRGSKGGGKRKKKKEEE
jgi:hypothetical protein